MALGRVAAHTYTCNTIPIFDESGGPPSLQAYSFQRAGYLRRYLPRTLSLHDLASFRACSQAIVIAGSPPVDVGKVGLNVRVYYGSESSSAQRP